MSSKRESNYELIRIIAMILIIIHHVFVHCINEQLVNPDMYKASKLFNDYTVYNRLVITDFAAAFGKIGNVLFILITGYFLIDRKINISKQIIKVLSEMFFVALILIIASFIHLRIEDITSSINIRNFNESWWFAGYYISIVLIAWIGLNKYVKGLDKAGYKTLLIVLFAVISIGWIRGNISKLGIDSILTGVFIYLCGGYIKLYNPLGNIKSYKCVIATIIFFVIMGISFMNYSATNINAAILDKKDSYKQVIYGYSDYSLPCLVIGIMLFEIIRRWNIKSSSVINYIASAMFITYLVHDNGYVYTFFYKVKWLEMIYKGEYLQIILFLLLIVVSVMALGIILYSIYNLCFKGFKKFIQN